MNVLQFIDSRKTQWNRLERIVEDMKTGVPVSQHDFRDLTLLYRSATSDFAFAQTHFPEHDVAGYLNKLVGSCHGLLYRRRPVSMVDFATWLTRTVPGMFWDNIRVFVFAFSLFTFGGLVGFLGAHFVPEGEKVFLFFSVYDPQGAYTHAANYIEMTEENIEDRNPFGVYESGSSFGMSGRIFTNNIYVAIFCFVGGALAGTITFWSLFTTGMMVGAFYHLFFRHGLGFDFWNTILVHGMIELSMIVVSATCGFMVAKAFLFPGRETRGAALRRMGGQSVQIALVMAMWLVLAGIFEGFVTGAHLHWGAKLAINAMSLGSLIFYWGFLGYAARTRKPVSFAIG